MNFPKNFAQKLEKVGPTCVGNFFTNFFQKFKKIPTLCRVASFKSS